MAADSHEIHWGRYWLKYYIVQVNWKWMDIGQVALSVKKLHTQTVVYAKHNYIKTGPQKCNQSINQSIEVALVAELLQG